MRKIKFFILALMALPLIFISCGDEDGPSGPVSYVEDGFYVVGEATSIIDLLATDADKALMAPGINENDGQSIRTGMYEKYVALEGGKSFSLVLKAGASETKYGAALTKVNLTGTDDEGNPYSVNDQPTIEIQRGTLVENGNLQVTEDGLYHVVVDVPLNAVIIAPVEWGVRGAMNGWQFTAFPKPTFNKTSMTYKLTGQQVDLTGGFKFSYGGGWKVELNPDGTPVVKANTNLGNDLPQGDENKNKPLTVKLAPGGPDIGIERAIWSIELTWALAKGAVKEGFTAKLTKTGDLEPLPEYFENLYINGSFVSSDWDWNNERVITMTPVHSHANAFWTITYFDAGTEFKFAPGKAWSGDFGVSGAAVDGIYAQGGSNIAVADAGYYMIYVDLKEEKIFVGDPSVYLMGDCSKDGKWDAGVADNLFDIAATGLTKTTFGAGELRMYATCPLAIGVDWWQMEFIILDGKIAYRGKGDDQERVTVAAGQTITLDFKAGTGTIK